MSSKAEDIVKLKLRVGIILLVIGILFIFLSGLGIINFTTATVELGPAIRVINSSPGIVLIVIGWLIISRVKVIRKLLKRKKPFETTEEEKLEPIFEYESIVGYEDRPRKWD